MWFIPQSWIGYWLPHTPAVATTHQRERYRKSRLLVMVMLINLALALLPIISYALTGPVLGEYILWPGVVLDVAVLWLNRKGYYEVAALSNLLVMLGMILAFTVLIHPKGEGSFWVIFLALPTFLAGLFLGVWVPWLFGLLDCIIFTLIWCFPRLLPWFDVSTLSSVLLASTYFLFFFIAMIASVYAWSIQRAVRQADRTEELELVNQRLYESNEELNVLQGVLLENITALQSLATTDPLTGLANHRAIAQHLEDEMERASRYAHPFALLFCDLDHFKAINDTYGHSSGDTVLQIFARTILATLRQHDIVGRWGGEEFLMVLPEMQEADALQSAERIRAAIASQDFSLDALSHVTCSIGVACYPRDGTQQKTLLDAADRAMYVAKQSGRNQVCNASQVAIALVPQVATSTHAPHLAETVYALVALLEARDAYTGEHTQTVGHLMEEVALHMHCDVTEAHSIGLAGCLHDIGKVAIPDAILQKPGKLTTEEWHLMRTHPAIGAEMVARFPNLDLFTAIIRSHHEAWDGQGYPYGLAGTAIPLGGRIAAVVDAYNAMTTNRPYQSARTPEAAQAELQRCAGSQFDPEVVAAFLQVLAIRQTLDTAA